MKKNYLLLFLPVLMAGIFIFCASNNAQAVSAAKQKPGQVYGVQISGLSAACAKQKIYNELLTRLKDKTLTIVTPQGKHLFTYPEIDFKGNILEIIDEAYLNATRKEPPPDILYYLKNCQNVVYGIEANCTILPTDAQLQFLPNQAAPFEITPEVYGKGIDSQLLLKQIDASINSSFEPVYVKKCKIYPQITQKELKNYTFLKAQYSTAYPYSTAERKHNIKLGASFLNGLIIAPGQEFSFNAFVGARTQERGFLTAKIISDGKYIDGVGGGVCQISTTLYNAILLAGLTVTEQHPHSMNVGYAPPSFDAMVNSYTSDLKFINNTSGNIYLKVIATDSQITVYIYGSKPLYEYRLLSQIVETVPPPEPEIIVSDTAEIVQHAKCGIKSLGFIETYLNGQFVRRTQIRSDFYKPTREIKKVIQN